MPQTKERYRERYYKRRNAGICTNCGKMPAKRRTRCEWCREQCRTKRGKQAPISKEYRRAWYVARRSKGLCVSCGFDAEGKARCSICQEMFRSGVRERCRQRKANAPATPKGRTPVNARPIAKDRLESFAARHGITVEELQGRNNHHVVVNARRELARKLREQGWVLRQIAALLGKHYTTVMNLLSTEMAPITDVARANFLRDRAKRTRLAQKGGQ